MKYLRFSGVAKTVVWYYVEENDKKYLLELEIARNWQTACRPVWRHKYLSVFWR